MLYTAVQFNLSVSGDYKLRTNFCVICRGRKDPSAMLSRTLLDQSRQTTWC